VYLESLVATAALRFTPRQRDVDFSSDAVRRHQLVDREALTHRFDTPERSEQRRQPILWNAEDFDVDVLRRLSAKAIADPAADDERPAAGCCRGVSDATHDVQLISHEGII
jgi:hypothetical protein